MTKKKDLQLNNEDEPATSSQSDATIVIHKKHKKHKHKKHKRKKVTDQDEDESGCGSPGTPGTSSEGVKQPALKLKIRIGGQTLGEKSISSVIKNEIPEPDSDDSTKDDISIDSDVDEEEAWLDALESGRLEEVDEELKKMKDPTLMTARQRALLENKTKEKEEAALPPVPLYPQSEMSEEMIERRLIRAKKRKQQADEKREKDKKQTIERLLKKSDAKIKGTRKFTKKASQPNISYIANNNSAVVCLPPGYDFPLTSKTPPVVPAMVVCGVVGCNNVKKYSCSRTGTPLCSLSCYKKNLQVLAIMPSQPVV